MAKKYSRPMPNTVEDLQSWLKKMLPELECEVEEVEDINGFLVDTNAWELTRSQLDLINNLAQITRIYSDGGNLILFLRPWRRKQEK